MSIESLAQTMALVVVSGLFVGKPLGILVLVGLAVGLRIVQHPDRVNWAQLIGIAFACGIGFTMSLFIAGLAFENTAVVITLEGDRLGVLVDSILSA